jgi:hypothetical protein
MVVACVATDLTVRELAAVVGLSKSTVHRIVAMLAPVLPTWLGRPRTWIAGKPGSSFRGSTVEALTLRHRRVLADGGYRGVRGLRGIASSAIGPFGGIGGAALASSTPSPA